MCAAAVLAVATNELATSLVGAGAAVFVAALAVGVGGRLVGYRKRRSPLVFIVPGVLLLVPGSTGFRSVLQLLDDQTVSGITAGFDTFVAAMSIAYGLLVSTLLLPRRVTEVGGRGRTSARRSRRRRRRQLRRPRARASASRAGRVERQQRGADDRR